MYCIILCEIFFLLQDDLMSSDNDNKEEEVTQILNLKFNLILKNSY